MAAADFHCIVQEAASALARLQAAHEAEVARLRSELPPGLPPSHRSACKGSARGRAPRVKLRPCTPPQSPRPWPGEGPCGAGPPGQPSKLLPGSQHVLPCGPYGAEQDEWRSPSAPVCQDRDAGREAVGCAPPAFEAQSAPSAMVPTQSAVAPTSSRPAGAGAAHASIFSRASLADESAALACREALYKSRLIRKEGEHKDSAELTKNLNEHEVKNIAAKITDSLSFESFVGFMILMNCILVGVEVQLFAQHRQTGASAYLDFAGYGMYVFFLLEVLLRISSRGLLSFLWSGSSIGWNWFDAIVVVMSSADFVLTIVLSSRDAPTGFSSARALRLIKIARMMRLVRVARIVRFVSALRMLIHSIIVSLKSIIWALLLFLLILYAFAVVFTQEMAQSAIDEGSESFADVRSYYWSSIEVAMFTLFKSICGGVSWQDVLGPLRERSVFLQMLFVGYVWFMYFVALNVITGSFCSSAAAAAANDPDILAMGIELGRKTRMKQAYQVFRAIDVDGSGSLTISELDDRLSDSDVQGLFLALNIDIKDARKLFGVMDVNKSGTIDVNEFVAGCTKLTGSVSNIDIMCAAAESKRVMKCLTRIMSTLEKLHSVSGREVAQGAFHKL